MRQRFVGAVVGGVMMASATCTFGTGIASAADPLAGKTYSEAVELVTKWKGKPVISTVVGTQLKTSDCIVTSSRVNRKTAQFYLALFCDDPVASAIDPGNSAASPVGREAKKEAAKEKWLRETPGLCAKLKGEHPEWFKAPVKGCEGLV